jgi:type II secretory pathway predicted ATPase ExeA
MPAKAQTTQKPAAPLPAILGLDRQGSPPNGNQSFFFRSPLLQQRLSLLNQMVGGHSMFIVVIGERGSGKSTLMHELISMTGHRWQACRFKVKSRKGKSQRPWKNLNNRAAYRSVNESPPSLIIDDAHQLTPSELKKLLQSAFSKPERRKFQSIVLFSEPSIRERFADIARWLPPRSVIDKIFMTPLSEQQTADYLKHRLRASGLILQNPFTPDQIRDIHQRSGGLPGRINGEAYLLLKGMSQGQRKFKRSKLAKLFKWHEVIKWKTGKVVNLPVFNKGFSLNLKS